MSRGGLLIAGAAASLLVVLAGALWSGGGGIPAGDVTLHRVERGPFRRTALAVGVLEAVQATPITVPLEAPGMQRIAWTVDDGTFVRKGDVVIRFDSTDMESDLADGLDEQARSDEEIRKASTDNETKRTNLLLDAAQAEREYDDAESFASHDTEVFSRHDIIDSEIDRDLAAATAETARRRSELAADQGRTDLELLEIERGKASLKVRTARHGLSALSVSAPHDGLLILNRDWRGNPVKTGDEVWPGRKLAEIPDPASMQARVFVLEADAGGLGPGLPATLVVEAHPELSFAGRVERVDALAKPRDPGVPVNYFEAVVVPGETRPDVMKPGQRVRATIVLEEFPEVITVPRQAVFDDNGAKVVYRAGSGRLEPVEVVVGAHSLSRIMITEGLDPGDRVALRDPSGGPPPGGAGEDNGANGPRLSGGRP